MLKIRKLAGSLLLAAMIVALAACNGKTPAPTNTPQPSDTPAPTNTTAPSQTQSATATIIPLASRTPSLNATGQTTAQPTLPGQPTTQATQPVQPTQPGLATLAVTLPPGSGAPDKALYVSQNLADNYQMKPGTAFNIIWTVKNVGTTTWTTGYQLRSFIGPKADKLSYPFPQKVAPGASVDLSLNLVAPSQPGTYNTWWKLTNDAGQNFGDVNFVFIVTNTPGAPTVTPKP